MPNGTASGPTPPSVERYAAFVSYRHAELDRRWAKWLHVGLETYRVPHRLVQAGAPRRLGRVFRDEEELAASADLSERIDDALERARHLIVVCSPRTPESRWVDEEVRRFQAMGRGTHVLALLIEGEPGSSFPPALRNMEPLAADVRPMPGESQRALRHVALLKLIAALLDVPFDELRRRDEERLRRRWIFLGATSSVAAAAFLGLAAFALRQWDRAETELRISRAQNLAAQSQIAYAAATRLGDTGAVDGAERGVLLALESLRAYPTVAGDQVLRAGMRKLNGPALEVRLREDETLAAVGPHAAWILVRNEAGYRVFDRETRSYRAPGATELAAANASPTLGDGEIMARSPDGALSARRSEEGVGDWVFASAEIVKTADAGRVALLPHEWHLAHAQFTLDSQFFVTVTARASMDAAEPGATALVGSTVRVWSVSDWRKLTEVSLANEGGIGTVSASIDGEWLATTIRVQEGPGEVVLLWPVPPKVVQAEACRRLSRNLSPSEWFTFVSVGKPRETCPGLPITSE
jgi:hypothetical protein